jgi:hypothetical protein
MAAVTIDSGPVDATYCLRDVPQDKWLELMQVRRDFLGVRLPYDCRSLLEFVEDGEQMYGPLGFGSVEDFIERGLQLNPQDVAWAIDGLRRMKPHEAIPYKRAILRGKAGRPKKGEGNVGDANISKGGTTAPYIVARLERDAPEIAKQLARGEFKSARAAGIAAGFIKTSTPFEIILKQLPKLTKQERNKLRVMLNDKRKVKR